MTAEQIEALKAVLPESVHEKLTEEATLDTVKELTGSVYVDKELAEKERKAEIGKVLGSVDTKLKRILGDAAKGKTTAELAAMAEEAYQAKLTELEEARKGGDGDVEKLRAEAAQAKKDKADVEKMLEQANTEKAEALQQVESAKAEALTVIEQYKLNQAINSEWDAVNWTDDADVYKRKGLWMAEIEGKYTFKVENGKKYVYDADGNIVKNGTQHMEAGDLFRQIAEKANALKKNGAGNEPPKRKDADPSVKLSPTQLKAIEAKEKMKQGSTFQR
jgi:hypothetical protein